MSKYSVQKHLNDSNLNSTTQHGLVGHHHICRRSDKSFKKGVKNMSTITSINCLLSQDPLPVDTIKQAELLLSYKSFTKIKNKERFLKQLDVKICDRYKLREMSITKRINQIDKNLDHVCVITDVDEEFFKIVNGRPFSHTIPLYKSLQPLLNSHLRLRQEIGYKKDCVLNIEINSRKEKNIYEMSLQRLTEQAAIFDKFIMGDYQNSMLLLEKGEKLNNKLDVKMRELQNLADDSFTIISRLIGLDYKYSLQQKYGRFLYYLSPPTWRSSNREFARSIEIEAKGFDFGSSNDEDTFTVIFDKMRKECASSMIRPVLYFSRPEDLMDVFIGMEKQQLYYISREMQVFPHLKSLKEGVQKLKETLDLDNSVVTASITGFKKLLLFCEEQSAELKKQFFRILNGLFYESVGTPEVLKLILHLEFCYDKVYLEKPMNIDMLTMAKAIESMYMDYSNLLDAIQSDTVRKAMKKCMDIDKRKLIRAKRAAKELRLFSRLEQELLRAYNLISPKMTSQNNHEDKQKFIRNHSKSRAHKNSHRSLTDAEKEYLSLFTDWTLNEDPTLYLQSLSDDQQETTE